MSLVVEVFQKIRLMLDKPISPLARNQIIQLINKQVVSPDDLVPLFSRKYRTDLLLYIVENQTISFQKLQFLLQFIIAKLLYLKYDEASLIWKNILKKQVMITVRKQWTNQLFKQSLRNSNETLKSMQFSLLRQNINLNWECNEGEIFKEFTRQYCKSFIKYSIYIPSFISILNEILQKIENLQNNLIEAQARNQLLIKLIQILKINKNKQTFAFQNECLRACWLLLQSKKSSINDLIIMHAFQTTLENYLWKKPTREQAFKCKQSSKKINMFIKDQNKKKMIRNYQQIKYENDKPLIEQVIDKATQYRKNQHIFINESFVSQNQKKSKFLKRGDGNGGGKSTIVSPIKRPNSSKMIGDINKLEDIIEQCFRKTQQSNILKVKRQIQQDQQVFSPNPSIINIEEDEQYCEISNLIDLAYQYKFYER